ncbi:MAG: glutaminyl-peptide cyclotransferase [Hallerella porci]|uniref:Glutamine cyclotransferase n=1 Tax=Hallerella porci TaxID=1945871 RepID=A0ABX5LSM3_9BACT|nr:MULTISPECIES: glutaminyl-peptide cyclotransferase [Hallerella]MCI5600397.1 glutaminyl-peptide cyclotransferase [Hallerella sp.]MDY3922614.1 glutaminyl-peptide cyclotransferase [Hallerella porci]PWL04283.1 glutamine cyclotransferase [Hallerella porci]
MFAEIALAALLGQFSVLDSVEHHPENYTQGFFFHGKTLYETTGRYGDSRLLRYPEAGKPATDSLKLSSKYFGEGSVQFGNDIFWLTWREGKAFVIDAKTLTKKSEFEIPGEGWGLTLDGGALILSDGSANLYWISPGDKRVFKTLEVRDGERKIKNLNELEMVDGKLYANVWLSDSIAVIDIHSGAVLEWLDFSKIAEAERRQNSKAEVLNGIAYDGKFLWITGKYWKKTLKILRK